MFEYITTDAVNEILAGKYKLDINLIHVCGIGDYLYALEKCKEDELFGALKSRINQVPKEYSSIDFVEVDRVSLLDGLFKEEDEVYTLNTNICDRMRPPYITLNYVALTSTGPRNYWDTTIFEKMQAYYGY